MATVDKLQAILNSKADIKEAIETKGVTVGNAPLSDYSDLILTISGGGGDEPIGDGDFLVVFYDYDGTILKQKRVDSGGSVEPPTIPTNSRLVFQSWNTTEYSNVTRNLHITPYYNTTSGYTEIDYEITTTTGYKPILNFSNTSGVSGIVSWGDGQTTSFSGTGTMSVTPTDSLAVGLYTLKIETTGAYYFGIGSSTFTFGSAVYNQCIKNVYLCDKVTQLAQYAFYNCYSLYSIAMPNVANALGQYAFANCGALKSISLPNTITSIGQQAMALCSKLNFVNIPTSTTTLTTRTFNGCYGLIYVSFPNGFTSLQGDNIFNVGYSIVEYDYMRCTNTSILQYTNAFSGINATCKIKVPSSLLDRWKTASNWSTYANYIV